MAIRFALEPELSAQEFRHILIASTLAERRPANDLDRLEKMLRNANLVVTARDGAKLVGLSRAITDFAYAAIFPISPSMSLTSVTASASA